MLPESIHKAIHINQSLIEIYAILLQAFCRSALRHSAVCALAIAEYEKNANYELAYIIHHLPNNGGFVATHGVSVKKFCGVLFFYSCAVHIAVTSYKTAMKKILLLCDM